MVRNYRSRFVFVRLFLAATLAAMTRAQRPPQQHVNWQRLQSTSVKLSEYGRNPDGVGYSETEMAKR